MQTQCIREQLDFEGIDGRRVVGAFDGGEITSGAGAKAIGMLTSSMLGWARRAIRWRS